MKPVRSRRNGLTDGNGNDGRGEIFRLKSIGELAPAVVTTAVRFTCLVTDWENPIVRLGSVAGMLG